MKDSGRFIPLPSTWLHQRRWEDEALTSHSTGPLTQDQVHQREMDELNRAMREMNDPVTIAKHKEERRLSEERAKERERVLAEDRARRAQERGRV